jgi:aryl-alcohol dehydrogenase-like predicted oxidoreductase
MKERLIGTRRVSAIGLGGAKLSLHADRPSERDAMRTIHAALDAGVALIDSSDVYGQGVGDTGHNERLIARALRTWSGDPGSVLVATKGGQWWDGGVPRFDGSRARLRAACEASLRALQVEAIGLYLLHRLPRDLGPDGARWDETFYESLETLEELRREGKILASGLSNVDSAMVKIALESATITAIQNRIGILAPLPRDVLDLCEEHGFAFLGWGPLKGTTVPDPASAAGPPAPEAGRRLGALSSIAARRGVSVQQITLAWELSLSPQVIPVVGARRPESIRDSLKAAGLVLTEGELALLNGSDIGGDRT